MASFIQFSHQKAQQDAELIKEAILIASGGGFPTTKAILIAYENLLKDRNNLQYSRDSLIYRTILKMSLINSYKPPSVSSFLDQSYSMVSLPENRSKISWLQRLEMAYQWLFYSHLINCYRVNYLNKIAFQSIRSTFKSTKKIIPINENMSFSSSQHDNHSNNSDSGDNDIKINVSDQNKSHYQPNADKDYNFQSLNAFKLLQDLQASNKAQSSIISGKDCEIRDSLSKISKQNTLIDSDSSVNKSKNKSNNSSMFNQLPKPYRKKSSTSGSGSGDEAQQEEANYQQDTSRKRTQTMSNEDTSHSSYTQQTSSSQEDDSQSDLDLNFPNLYSSTVDINKKESSESFDHKESDKQLKLIKSQNKQELQNQQRSTLQDSFALFLQQNLQIDEQVDMSLDGITKKQNMFSQLNKSSIIEQNQQNNTLIDSLQQKQNQSQNSFFQQNKLKSHSVSYLSSKNSSLLSNKSHNSPSLQEIQSKPLECLLQEQYQSIIENMNEPHSDNTDSIITTAAFRMKMQEKADSCEKILLNHVFKLWKRKSIDLLKIRKLLNQEIVNFYASFVFYKMKNTIKQQEARFVKAKQFIYHQRNKTVIKALKGLRAALQDQKQVNLGLDPVKDITKMVMYKNEIHNIQDKILAENSSDKFAYFKNQQIVQYNQEIQVINNQIKQQIIPDEEFYKKVYALRKFFMHCFPSIESIIPQFQNRKLAQAYDQLITLVDGKDEAEIFKQIFNFVKRLMVKGYSIIPASVHTLRRPIDYLTFLQACKKYQLYQKHFFFKYLKFNVEVVHAKVEIFVQKTKFNKWRRVVQYRNRMKNIDEFLEDYHNEKILKKRSLTHLVQEYRDLTLIEPFNTRLNNQLLKSAFTNLKFCAKESLYTNHKFVAKIDIFFHSRTLHTFFNLLVNRYNFLVTAEAQAQQISQTYLKHRILTSFRQSLAVQVFKLIHFKNFYQKIAQTLFSLSKRKWATVLAFHTTQHTRITRYKSTALHSMLNLNFYLKNTFSQLSFHYTFRVKKEALTALREKLFQLRNCGKITQQKHLTLTVCKVAVAVFKTSKDLFKLHVYLEKRAYRKYLDVYLAWKNHVISKSLERQQKFIFTRITVQKSTLKQVFDFWRKFSAIWARLSQRNINSMGQVFRHWNAQLRDKLQFNDFKPVLINLQNLQNQPNFIIKSGQISPSDRLHKQQIWRKILACFESGTSISANENLLKFCLFELIFNAKWSRQLRGFVFGLKMRLDRSRKIAVFDCLRSQAVKERGMLVLVNDYIQRTMQKAWSGLVEKHRFFQEKLIQVYMMDQNYRKEKALQMFKQRCFLRKSAVFHLVGRDNLRIQRVALSFLFLKFKKIVECLWQILLKHQRGLLRRAFLNFRGEFQKQKVIQGVEEKVEQECTFLVRRTFTTMIDRADQFITFRNQRIDKVLLNVMSSLMAYSGHLKCVHDLIFSVYKDRLQKQALNSLVVDHGLNLVAQLKLCKKELKLSNKIFYKWRILTRLKILSWQLVKTTEKNLKRKYLMQMKKSANILFAEQILIQLDTQRLIKDVFHLFKRKIVAQQTSNQLTQITLDKTESKAFQAIILRKNELDQLEIAVSNAYDKCLQKSGFNSLKVKQNTFSQIIPLVEQKSNIIDKALLRKALGTWIFLFVQLRSIAKSDQLGNDLNKKQAFNGMIKKFNSLVKLRKRIKSYNKNRLKKQAFQGITSHYIQSTTNSQKLEQLQSSKNFKLKNFIFNHLTQLYANTQQIKLQVVDFQNKSSKNLLKITFQILLQKHHKSQEISHKINEISQSYLLKHTFTALIQKQSQLITQFNLIQTATIKQTLKLAFGSISHLLLIQRSLCRVRVSFMLISWLQTAQQTKLRLRDSELQRRALGFIEKRRRMQIKLVFSQFKLQNLKFQQMEKAADGLFFSKCEAFSVWRQVSFDQRKEKRNRSAFQIGSGRSEN